MQPAGSETLSHLIKIIGVGHDNWFGSQAYLYDSGLCLERQITDAALLLSPAHNVGLTMAQHLKTVSNEPLKQVASGHQWHDARI